MRLGSIPPLPAFVVLYGAIYAAFGVASPFWPQFFVWRGLSPGQVGLLLGLGTFIRLLSGPLVGRLSDLSGALRGALGTCTVVSVIAALGLLVANGFSGLLIVHLVQAAALAPLTSLADALALNAARPGPRRPGFEYGWVRGSGSAAFVAGTLAAGQMLGVLELSSIVWMHAVLLLAAGFATTVLPRPQLPPAELGAGKRPVWAGVAELWRIGLFRRLVVVAALVLGSHAMHDAFAVIRWSEAGIGPAMISVLWSEAVAAEVLMFFVIGPALVTRIGPHGAAALAAAVGIVRWVALAATTSALVIGIVEPLHGVTFALLHLACMRLIVRVVPDRLAATAQALYALGAGLATAALMAVSGELYAALGGRAFLPMAVLCAVALPLARAGLRPTGREFHPARG